MLNFILKMVAPIAKFMAKIKQPDPHVDDQDFTKLKQIIDNGDCLVSRTKWQLTNLFMPGYWKHAAIYMNGYVYEASSKYGVQKVSLEEFFFKKDFVGLCRYEAGHFNDELFVIGKDYLDKKVGKPYDWDLYLSDNDKYYCSELCYYFYCLCFEQFDKSFKASKYLKKIVIRPTDMWNNFIQLGRWS